MSNKIYKGLARYERNGIVILTLLIILLILSKKYIVQYFIPKEDILLKNDTAKWNQLQHQIETAKTYNTFNYSTNSKQPYNQDENNPYKNKYNTQKYSKDKNIIIEINSAKAEEFEKLYGIGKVLSARIVTFRDKLGGFHHTEQLKDVWGIQDSVYQKIRKNLTIKPAKPHKININTATFEELTVNPYLFPTVAKQIIGYRTKVKPFEAVDDVKNLYFVKDHPEHYDKMLPYITVN